MSDRKRIHVAIVGAGIAGLTLAVALNAFDKDHKFAIDLYEAAPELSEIGAGINVWPRTWQILKEIGLETTLIPFFDHYPDLERRVVFEVRKADQRDGFKVIDVMKDGGALRIHRADFQRSLIGHLPLPGSDTVNNSLCTLHLARRLIDYSDTSTSSSPIPCSTPLTLHFADKSSASCDILIGADGIKSTVRQLFLTRLPNPEKYMSYLDPVWSGTVVYRGLVPKEDLSRAFSDHRALNHSGVMYMGKNKHVVVYPVSGGKFLNVVAAIHDKTKEGTVWEGPCNINVNQDEFFGHFEAWEEEFQALIQCIKQPTKWPLQNLNHLDVFAKGRVFLIGDSAHAMVPHQGAGAGVGIEDAYILASLLHHSLGCRSSSQRRSKHLADVYNTMRVPQAIALSKASIRQGYLFTLHGAGFEKYKEGDDVPRDMLVDSFRAVERNWAWTTTDPDIDRRTATRYLEGEIRSKL